ncbi:hypothetical protein ACFPMF_08785 [Larkinella bovis]|uniref:DUF4397 domain-containing protein n=1 Tax=Larkinella bovis TaxID=683041 RepID=A0ABW0I952_9BACT
MRRNFHFLILLLGLAVLQGVLTQCKRNSEENSSPESKLKIVEFHLAGIPDKNIVINHAARTITVQMPPTLTSLSLKADYRLSPDTRLVSGLPNGELNVVALSKCYENQRIGLASTGSSSIDPSVQYALIAIPSGKLTLKPTQPLEIELGEGMTVNVPVENLYGSEPLVDARVTREGTTEKVSLFREQTPNNCVWFIKGIVNQVQVATSRQLQPGRYSLELVQADGTVVPVSQPLIIKKGKARLGYNQWTWGVMANEPFIVEGFNLFESDVSLTIIGKDRTYRPILGDFAADGTRFRVLTPALPPGNYIVKAHQNGQEITCQKMSVLREKGQPVLLSITNYGTCSTFEKLSLSRAKRIDLYYNPITGRPAANRVQLDEQLQFNRIDNPAETYSVPIVPYVLAGPEAPAYFSIPESVPVGQYHVKLQVKDPNTDHLLQSEPYERVIDVQ